MLSHGVRDGGFSSTLRLVAVPDRSSSPSQGLARKVLSLWWTTSVRGGSGGTVPNGHRFLSDCALLMCFSPIFRDWQGGEKITSRWPKAPISVQCSQDCSESSIIACTVRNLHSMLDIRRANFLHNFQQCLERTPSIFLRTGCSIFYYLCRTNAIICLWASTWLRNLFETKRMSTSLIVTYVVETNGAYHLEGRRAGTRTFNCQFPWPQNERGDVPLESYRLQRRWGLELIVCKFFGSVSYNELHSFGVVRLTDAEIEAKCDVFCWPHRRQGLGAFGYYLEMARFYDCSTCEQQFFFSLVK